MVPAIEHDISLRTVSEGRLALDGRRRGVRAFLPFVGPAVIASVAYMDPGNFATNVQAGAAYGYDLLWVVVLANLVAMLVQARAAKLGIVTGKNLAEHCREQFPRPVAMAMWIVSEAAAMATDLAEFLGGAIGLSLLFHLPLLWSMAVTGVATYLILLNQSRGFRPLELTISALVAVIGACYLAELFIAPPNWAQVAIHSIRPQLPDGGAVTLAVGIVGATVMPHAIYLHSSLTQRRVPPRDDVDRRRLVRLSNLEVILALGAAGLINMAMLAMASAAFHDGRHDGVASIETAYRTLSPVLGPASAGVFLLSLIASGISSSTVGTLAGQVIMQGFVNFSIPIWLRRLVTMAPAFVVVAMGVNTTWALILSQVVLSLVLPVPMIALLVLTGRRSVMGSFANGARDNAILAAAAGLTLLLNVLLLAEAAGAPHRS